MTRLVFLLSDEASIPVRFAKDPEHGARQEASTPTRPGPIALATFKTPDELAHLIDIGLGSIAASGGGRGNGVPQVDLRDIQLAGLWVRSYVDRIEDYYERGSGAQTPPSGVPFHNMGVYSWDVLDAALLTASTVQQRIIAPMRDDSGNGPSCIVRTASLGKCWHAREEEVVKAPYSMRLRRLLRRRHRDTAGLSRPQQRAGRGNCPRAGMDPFRLLNHVGRRTAGGQGGQQHLAAVRLRLRLGGRRGQVAQRAGATSCHFDYSVRDYFTDRAWRRSKLRPESRYFAYYTWPWISDDFFDPLRDAHLTSDEARAIDSAVDAFNESIIASVARARADGLDWQVFKLGGLMERLAFRRYVESPWAQPGWWQSVDMPPGLTDIHPAPNTRFFRAEPQGRIDGGLYSLDGAHPTTTGYALIANECMTLLRDAGVQFRTRDGRQLRQSAAVDFARIWAADTLNSEPPVVPTIGFLGWIEPLVNWVERSGLWGGFMRG